MRAETLVRAQVRELQVPRYVDRERGFVRLDENTNPLENRKAVSGLGRSRVLRALNRYGSQNADSLRRALAARFRVGRDWVVAGAGSDEILDMYAKAFLNPGDVVATMDPAFELHRFFARLHLGQVVEIPLIEGFQPDVERIVAARPKLTILSSPNNPTGNLCRSDLVEELAARSPGLILVDEAYAEYAGRSLLPLMRRSSNVAIIRTFSKAYGLAGLRVGYSLAPPAITEQLLKIKIPFNLNSLSEYIATRALADDQFVARSVALVRRERRRMMASLKALGFDVFPSDANFLFCRSPIPADRLWRELRRRKILIRRFKGRPGLEDSVRISIGTAAENSALLRAAKTIVGAS